MTAPAGASAPLSQLDRETRALVRLSAAITAGSEADVRRAVFDAVPVLRPEWADELLVQSYLFAGFPRMLNAAREWRRVSGRVAPSRDEGERDDLVATWRERGEATCAAVYGDFYPALRENMRTLHPAIDDWMIVEGYGKVLGRPALDLVRRELCIIAACLAGRQDRQLLSHLHGARNVRAPEGWIDGTLEALEDMAPPDMMQRARMLLARVRGK